MNPLEVLQECLTEAGDDVKSGLLAAEYILSINAALAVRHAPAGYTKERPLIIGGKPFVGGEFIPDEAWARATPEEKAQVEGTDKLSPQTSNRTHDLRTLVKDKFGVTGTVTYKTDNSGKVYGEHGGNTATVVNPELGKERPISINFKTAPGVTETDHIICHELVHQAYSANSELGGEIANRLSKIKAANGSAISIYGAFEGPFENVIELGAVYSHSPEQLKDYSVEMYNLAQEWSNRLQGKELPINVFFAHDIHNRQAQGILNRAIRAAKRLTSAARSDLVAAVKRGVSESGRAILKFIEKYRLQFAKLLNTTQLAAILEGAREVASEIPTLAVFPGAVPPPPSISPREAVSLVDRLEKLTGEERAEAIYALPPDQHVYAQQALAAKEASPPVVPPTFSPPSLPPGSPEEIHFPTIEEAVKQLAEKNVMTRERFDALDAATKAKSFAVAGVDAEDTLIKIRDALAENVREGADYEAFKSKVLEAVDQGTFLSEAHMETVFRTNVQSAFSDGQMTVLQHPLVRSGFPYSAYAAIHDERVRDNHLALEKYGIGGTNIYRNDDPVFQTFRPPWDYNDRCSWTPLTVRQAAEAGVEEAKDWLSTGVEPIDKAFVPMPPFEPPPGFRRAVVSAPMSIRLSMQSVSDFYDVKWTEKDRNTAHIPTFPNTPDEYPRDASNRFVDKYSIAEAARDQECTALLRESVPADQQWKIDRAVAHLQSGGAVHHPKESSGLAININGEIVDHRWRNYSAWMEVLSEWTSRDADRTARRTAIEEAITVIRDSNSTPKDIDKCLKAAGATEAQMRAISRMRHRVGVSRDTEGALEDLYEDTAETLHATLDQEYTYDPKPDEPEEPTAPTPHVSFSAETGDGAAPVDDKEERIEIIAGILVLLFGDEAIEVAKRLKADSERERAAPALSINGAFHLDVNGIWHGPTPPSPSGWVQIAPGPGGGLRWAQTGAGGSAAQLPGPAPYPSPTPPPTPAPAPTAGKYAQAHQVRLARATAFYNYIMQELSRGGYPTPAEKSNLAKQLSVMSKPMLRSLYTALGGTATIVGSQRQPWVHAIKAILSAPVVVSPPPAQPATPSPAQSATPTSNLHRGANVVGGAPATAPLSAVPFKDETSWDTGKPPPGTYTLNGVDFAAAPPKFWEKVKDVNVNEPPPLSKVDRVGIMVQEPDGRIWIVQPTNQFGSRKYTIPGGGVEHGLTNQQNALKEVWEETGLQVEITGYAGDFEDSNNKNNGRLYIGRRIGGAPWDAKIENHIINHNTGNPAAESEKVLLVTPDRASKLLHRTDDLAQLMVVNPIPLNTSTRGSGSEAMKKFLNGIRPSRNKYIDEKTAKGEKPGIAELRIVQDMRGYNKKPTTVSNRDFDALMAKGGHIEVLRGIESYGNMTAKQLVDEFREGEHFPGKGVFGAGTYADSTKGMTNKAREYSGYGTGEIIRIAIPKTAKIVKVSDLEKAVPVHPEKFVAPGGSTSSSVENWMGVQAALAGYDAIYVDGKQKRHPGYGKGFYIILNRGIVTVQDKPTPSGYTIK